MSVSFRISQDAFGGQFVDLVVAGNDDEAVSEPHLATRTSLGHVVGDALILRDLAKSLEEVGPLHSTKSIWSDKSSHLQATRVLNCGPGPPHNVTACAGVNSESTITVQAGRVDITGAEP
jgi:hypothetical protein